MIDTHETIQRPAKLDTGTVYSDGDIATILGVTHATLSRARRNGVLRAARLGKRWYYLGEWILEWISAAGVPQRRGGRP